MAKSTDAKNGGGKGKTAEPQAKPGGKGKTAAEEPQAVTVEEPQPAAAENRRCRRRSGNRI